MLLCSGSKMDRSVYMYLTLRCLNSRFQFWISCYLVLGISLFRLLLSPILKLPTLRVLYREELKVLDCSEDQASKIYTLPHLTFRNLYSLWDLASIIYFPNCNQIINLLGETGKISLKFCPQTTIIVAQH